MKAAGAVALVIVVVGAACGGSATTTTKATTTTTKPTAKTAAVPDPAPWLLAVSELPTGWATDSTPGSAKGVCNGPLPSDVGTAQGGRSAKANFSKDNEYVSNGDFAFATPAAANKFIDSITAQTHSCTQWTETDNGTQVTATAGDLSFPNMGDRTYAFHLDLKASGVQASGDYVYARKGPNVMAIVDGGFFTDTDQLQQLATTALAKVPAR